MELKSFIDFAKSAKTIGVGVVFIVTSTWGFIAWSENQTKAAILDSELRQKAQQSLIHDTLFQKSRITKKELEMQEDQRELDTILDILGDEEPSPAERRRIEFLSARIQQRKQEIEAIERELEESFLHSENDDE